MKILKKVCVVFVISMLLIPYIFDISVSMANTTSEVIVENEKSTNLDEVSFDVYFKENTNKVYSSENSIKNGGKLYISVSLKDSGWISDGKVEFKNANFKISENEENKNQFVKNVENNVVYLNNISYGQDVEIELQVNFEKNSTISEEYINKETEVAFSANYMIDDNEAEAVNGSKKITNIWKEAVAVGTNLEITKTFSLNSGFLIESTLNTIINDDILPRKNESIEITAPSIDNIFPDSVYVVLNGEKIQEENVSYDKETGKIIIENQTEKIEDKLEWLSPNNEYRIVYRYLNNIDYIGKDINITGNINTELLSGEKIQNNINNNFILEEKGRVINVSSNVTESIYKGYLYANSKFDTNYNENTKIEISNIEELDSIEINFERASFSNDLTNQTVNNVVYYTSSKINKEQLLNIIGEEGFLDVYDENNESITRVTKDTQEDENGDIILNYINPQNNIRMVLSKPISEGNLEIKNEKIIKGNTGFTREQLRTITKIKNIVSVQGISVERVENTVNILETEYQVNTQISNNELSTIEQNKNIDIIGVLRTDSNKYNLYENPSIQIIFPVEVTDVNVNSINLLYGEELKIIDAHKERNEAGNIVVVINLEGKQTDYQINEITQGANIVVNCDITLDEKATNKDEKINYIVSQGEDVIQSEIGIVYKAPKEVTSVDKVVGYAQDEETKTVMGKGATVKLGVNEEEKVVTFENSIMNYNETAIENVSILGKMPLRDVNEAAENDNSSYARNVEDTQEIGLTLEQPLQINNTNAQIYYSTNENATKDLAETNNAWTENPDGAKSYLVVLPNGMQTKEILDISFQAEVPENLNYNKTSQYDYDVYYTLNGEEKSYSIEPVVFTTGEGPDVEVDLSSSQSESIYQEQMIDFTAKVTNTGDEVAENIILTANIPEGANYVVFSQTNSMTDLEEKTDRQISWNIESLEPGKTYEQKYTVIAKKNEDIQNLTFNTIATVEGFEKIFESNQLNFEVKEAAISVRKESSAVEESYIYNGVGIEYGIIVKNITDQPINNITIEDVIPEGLDFQNSYYIDEAYNEELEQTYEIRVENPNGYDEATRKVTWNIDTLEPNEEERVIVATLINSEEETQSYINTAYAITEDGNRIPSNSTANTKVTPKVSIEKSSSVENMYIKENQEFEYYIKVKNEGKTSANIILTDTFADGIITKELIYDINGANEQTQELYNNRIASVTTTIPVGGTLNVVIKVQADILEDGEQEREIVNFAEVEGTAIEKQKSNEVIHIIEYDPSLHPEEPDEPDEPDETDTPHNPYNPYDPDNPQDPGDDEQKYRLSGIAWLDKNENGIREENEARISQIFVQLLNAETNQFMQDEQGGILTVVTDVNGNYTFENLPSGKYIVIFVYDTLNYKTTIYHEEGVSALVNSDAIDKKVTYQSAEQIRGVTDIITIEDVSISNIDIGLVERAKFDLSLTKDINQITVTIGKSSSIYRGNAGVINKIEVDGKKLNQTTIQIDYVIKVRNEGDIAGYAKEVWDYMPEQLTFNAQLNSNWREQEGKLISTELENTLIQPGEEKEIHLILTKNMQEDDVGTMVNTAEIGSDYNERGASDVNSTAGNNNNEENDLGIATLIIGIKTGRTILYIGLTIGVILVIGLGVYLIKKKVIG